MSANAVMDDSPLPFQSAAEARPLRTLVAHALAFEARTSLEMVHKGFTRNNQEFAAALDGQHVAGVCSRSHIGDRLGLRYGFALFSASPIREFLLPECLVVQESTPMRTVLQQALSRRGEAFDMDVALVNNAADYLGMIPVQALVRVQSEIVADQLLFLQDQEKLLRQRNADLQQSLSLLHESQERLQHSNRELEEFAYVASHDLQEPLRKIQAFGERLHSKWAAALGDQGADYLTRIRHAAQRMQTLINDLLQFSRLTTQAQPFVPTDLAQVAREVLADLEVRIQETQARIEVGELPVIQADPLQMRQLLQNLIGNALKFHKPGAPPQIRVTCAPSVGDNGSARYDLIVADNGIGFDPKYADQIFTIFQRLNGTGQFEGTGVGLAICKKICEHHRGTIAATGTPGAGATFVARLPGHSPGAR